MQGFMKNVDIGGLWRMVGILAVVGSAALTIGFGWLMVYLYRHLQWVA